MSATGALAPFVDLHTHVLPGVDDGAATEAEALAMLRLAHGDGTRRIVATPHLFRAGFGDHSAADLRRRFAAFEETLAAWRERPETAFLSELRCDLGAEHHLSPEFFDALAVNAVVPYGDSRRLLVELPFYLPPEQAEAGLAQVLAAGYQPVMAHIERYPLLLTHRRYLRRLLDMGCLLQVNGESILSRQPRLRRICRELLRLGWVHAVASDAHHEDRRPPLLGQVATWLDREFGPSRTRHWLSHGPTAILDGGEIPAPEGRLMDRWASF